MLEGARQEALLGVDLYNQPRQARRLEGFFVHMHMAWLYLLHAEFKRGGIDYRYRTSNGRFERVDGEPKTWDLAKCAEERWPADSPVRKNLELTIALRNKIEHRYQEAVAVATAGYAQALLLKLRSGVFAQRSTPLSGLCGLHHGCGQRSHRRAARHSSAFDSGSACPVRIETRCRGLG